MYFFFAEVAESGGIMGMFENNLINWLLLVAFLWWIMATKLPPVFKGREEGIGATLAQTQKAREEAQALLERQKTAVANAEAEAENIIKEAKHAAHEMQVAIEQQSKRDIEDMLHKFEGALASERQVLVTQMRHASVKAAIALTEGQLSTQVTPEVKANLLNQFMAQLETLNVNSVSSGASLESASK
jgi:F0F1-type ATP synthase membrane subunit b/b'